MKLDKLLLKENNLKILSKQSFSNFKWINHTSLEGNPLQAIHNHAFLDTGVRELSFRSCLLSDLQPAALRSASLEKYSDSFGNVFTPKFNYFFYFNLLTH